MQPSTELKNLVLRLYDKESSGSLFTFAKNLYSHQGYVSLIGSQPDDRYEGYESIIRFYEIAGTAGYELSVNELKAYCENSFGWAMDLVTVKLSNGVVMPVRHTFVFHKEDEAWKIVHAHISVGIPDEQILNQ